MGSKVQIHDVCLQIINVHKLSNCASLNKMIGALIGQMDRDMASWSVIGSNPTCQLPFIMAFVGDTEHVHSADILLHKRR